MAVGVEQPHGADLSPNLSLETGSLHLETETELPRLGFVQINQARMSHSWLNGIHDCGGAPDAWEGCYIAVL